MGVDYFKKDSIAKRVALARKAQSGESDTNTVGGDGEKYAVISRDEHDVLFQGDREEIKAWLWKYIVAGGLDIELRKLGEDGDWRGNYNL